MSFLAGGDASRVESNSLLRTAANHNLLGEENMVLMQSVSLNDEPAAEAASDNSPPKASEDTLSEINLNENTGIGVGAVAEPLAYLSQNLVSQTYPSLLAPFSGSSEENSHLVGVNEASNNSPFVSSQQTPASPQPVSHDSGYLPTFASSLFQSFTGYGQDSSFQVSMEQPPTLTSAETLFSAPGNAPTVMTPSLFLPPQSGPAPISAPPVHSSANNSLSNINTNPNTATITSATSTAPVAVSAYAPSSSTISGHVNLIQSQVGTAPVQGTLLTPVTLNPFSSMQEGNQKFGNSMVTAPGNLFTPANVSSIYTAMVQGEAGKAEPEVQPVFTRPSMNPYSNIKEANRGGITTSAPPPTFFNPTAYSGSDAIARSMPAGFPSPLPSMSSVGVENRFAPPSILNSRPPVSFAPPPATSPIATQVASYGGNTVLPPTGAPESGGGINQFRMSSQKPSYVAYPGINTVDMGHQQSNFAPSIQTQNQTVQPSSGGQDFVHSGENSPPPTQFYGVGGSTQMPPPGPLGQAFHYVPIEYHWFFKKEVEGRPIWKPFSVKDSSSIEAVFNASTPATQQLVSTDGGRYDVDIQSRLRLPVYWEETQKAEVRRCSWFYRGPLDNRFIPYDEQFASTLEAEYYQAITTGLWHKRLELGGGEVVILHNPQAMVHYCQAASPDEWGNMPENQLRPRVVKRSLGEFEIEEGESNQIDQLVLVVHGIGSICDFKFRNVIEAVDEFRFMSYQLIESHFKEAKCNEQIGRIEFLPIQWHSALHGDGGIDKKLKPITLKSIPKLRNFTNDTLLDILFYTSPVYSQTIIDAVGNEINRIYQLFKERNPSFNGKVALGGHSLGSLIIFDILMHQPEMLPENKNVSKDKNLSSDSDTNAHSTGDYKAEASKLLRNSESRTVTYTVGPAGTGVQLINYPILTFHPSVFFAMGSPIAMFATVRGLDVLGEDFHFPTVPSFFNIFHPFDPVAYRIEPLIAPDMDLRPVLIPHHKGRKRLHLEFKETMERFGTDLKNKLLDSIKVTWNTVYQLANFNSKVEDNMEDDINRVIDGEFANEFDGLSACDGSNDAGTFIGKLNNGRRIDYVLQEAPHEILNEYVFALTSHVCYWSSEDTVLLIMKEIYLSMGVSTDSPLAQMPAGVPAPPARPEYGALPVPSPSYLPQVSNISANSSWNSASPLTQTFIPNPSTVSSPYLAQQFKPTAPPLYNSTSTPTPSVLPDLSSISLSSRTIGNRPVVSPDQFPVASNFVDPTAPISTNTNIGPPPLSGFIGSRKN